MCLPFMQHQGSAWRQDEALSTLRILLFAQSPECCCHLVPIPASKWVQLIHVTGHFCPLLPTKRHPRLPHPLVRHQPAELLRDSQTFPALSCLGLENSTLLQDKRLLLFASLKSWERGSLPNGKAADLWPQESPLAFTMRMGSTNGHQLISPICPAARGIWATFHLSVPFS